MSIHVALNHLTSYRCDRSISLAPHVFRLRPAVHCRTPVKSYSLTVRPEIHFINWQQDPFGNFLARVVFPEKTRNLTVEVDLVAEMTVINPFDFFIEEYAEKTSFQSFPVNANEVEARRFAGFWSCGHTPSSAPAGEANER